MGFNERKSNNNWRVAAVLLSSDIKKNGKLNLAFRCSVNTLDDMAVDGLIEADAVTTGTPMIDNFFHLVMADHSPNLESRKYWRGDIEACYSMLKTMLVVHILMGRTKDPSAFGWDEDDWHEVSAGRTLLSTFTEYKLFREAFLCSTEKDQSYLYRRLMYFFFPDRLDGLASIPICKYKFAEVKA